MAKQQTQVLLNLIGEIYQCALEPERWRSTVGHIIEAFGARSAGLALIDPHNPDLQIQEQYGFDEKELWAYATHYHAYNPWMPLHFQRAHLDEVYFGMHWISRRELARNAYWNEFMIPNKMFSAGGLRLALDGNRIAFLDIQQDQVLEDFSPAQRALLTELAPHLKRALGMTLRMGTLAQQVHLMQGQLDALSLGVILIDTEGRVAWVNRAAERHLLRGEHIKVQRNRLATSDSQELQRLLALIRAAGLTGNGAGLAAGGAMFLSSRHGGQPLAVEVSPVSAERTRFADPAMPLAAAVLLSDPRGPVSVSVETLQALYGLTPAEARLALELAGGANVSEAAERFGIARETARNQLKSIFAKTGARRQAELVRLVARLPGMARPT